MTNQSGGQTTEQKSAAERIEEARQLNRSISQTLNRILSLIEEGQMEDVRLLPKQMAALTAAVADINKKEAEFNDKFGTGIAEGEIDFNQLRRDIGCRLARIRKCCRA